MIVGTYMWAAHLFDWVSPPFTGARVIGCVCLCVWCACLAGCAHTAACSRAHASSLLPPTTHPHLATHSPIRSPLRRCPAAPVLFVLVRSVLTPVPVALFVAALLK